MAFYNPKTGIYRSQLPSPQLPHHTFQGFVTYMLGRSGHSSGGEERSFSIVDSTNSQGFTPSGFRQALRCLARALVSPPLSIKQGDVVFLLLPDSIFVPVIAHAVMLIGGVVAPSNPLNTRRELIKQAADSRASVIFATPQLLDRLDGLELPIIVVGGSSGHDGRIAFEHLLHYYKDTDSTWIPPNVRVRQSDPAALLYSSGTTGGSKGVVLSHGNLISSVTTSLAIKQLDDDDVCIPVLPMFHVAGFVLCCCQALTLGPRLVLLPRYDLANLLRAIDEFQVTKLMVAPPVVIDMVRFNLKSSRFNLMSLRSIHCGAAPLGQSTIDSFMSKFTHVKEFTQGYGMTETAATGFVGSKGVGRLMPCLEAKVIDPENGRLLPPNHAGEICFRGSTIMQGYLNNFKATIDAVDDHGWLHTGDLVKFDEEGNLFVIDRIKEIIKYNGYQVPPAELEDLLRSHPDIVDCAVVPYPDQRAGQIPHAYIVKSQSSNLDEGKVIEFITPLVSPQKKVRKVTFVQCIPRSRAGKILRKDLVSLSKL